MENKSRIFRGGHVSAHGSERPDDNNGADMRDSGFFGVFLFAAGYDR